MVMVHQSVEHYSEQFAKKLRRHNFTTPKNYLDFISTYLRLLERKNKENLAQVSILEAIIRMMDIRLIFSNNVFQVVSRRSLKLKLN